jgi:hypothetical protein
MRQDGLYSCHYNNNYTVRIYPEYEVTTNVWSNW